MSPGKSSADNNHGHKSSSTKHGKNSQRESFWETVLDKPKSSSKLNTSPVSASSDSAATGPKPLTLPGHAPVASGSSAGASSSRKAGSSGSKSEKKGPFVCEFCSSSYTQKGDMVRHVRYVHEGLRPYECSYCGNSFGRRSILNKHMKIHMKDQ